jgi:hypothetical protein
MLFFSVIGVVNSLQFISRRVDDIANRRELKAELEIFLLPVVINDPPPFETVASLQDIAVIQSAIWRIILTERERYEADMGVFYIPTTDVERAARALFGVGTFEHQSVMTGGTLFLYTEENHSYQIPENLSGLFTNIYTPVITSATNIGDTYTVTVDYMMLNSLSIAGFSQDEEPIKTMIYTINRNRERMAITAIRSGSFIDN